MLTANPKNRDKLAATVLADRLADLVRHAVKTGDQGTIDAAAAVVAALGTTVENLPGVVAEVKAEHDRETATLRRAKPIGKTS